MSNNYGLNKYKQTSVTTASRGQVLLMLYEGCMKFCRLAIEAIKRKDVAEKGKYILKVQDIINELSVTLDHNIGGAVSRELERLYIYMIDQLIQANLKNDPKPLEVVLKLLETLYSGWVTAVAQTNKVGNAAETAQAAPAPAGALTPTKPGGK